MTQNEAPIRTRLQVAAGWYRLRHVGSALDSGHVLTGEEHCRTRQVGRGERVSDVTATQAFVLVAGGVVTLLINLAIIVVAIKKWLTQALDKAISAPLSELEDDIKGIRKSVREVSQRALGAHNRIDRHLEVHKNG